jgi:hypothetical protein
MHGYSHRRSHAGPGRPMVNYNRDLWGPQKGRIKFWNRQFIFVVFNCANQWDQFLDFTAVAVRPEDLDFVS